MKSHPSWEAIDIWLVLEVKCWFSLIVNTWCSNHISGQAQCLKVGGQHKLDLKWGGEGEEGEEGRENKVGWVGVGVDLGRIGRGDEYDQNTLYENLQ